MYLQDVNIMSLFFFEFDVGIPSQLDEDSLHRVLTLPLGETGQLAGVDDAVVGVNTGQVDLADELDRRRLVRVLGTAVHLNTVDTVLVDGLNQDRLAMIVTNL
jgi:hypothetical protein